jgi:ribose transport system permease protein
VGSPAADTPPVDASARGRHRHAARLLLYRYAVVIVFIGFIVFFSLKLPDTFFTRGNLVTILGSQSVLLLLALGLMIPLSTGEFDLSIAAMLAFGSTLLADLAGSHGVNGMLAVIIVACVGALIGAVNALFVVGFGVNAFIVTLGTGTVLTGLTLWVSGGQILNGVPSGVSTFTNATLFDLPLPVYLAFGIALVLWYAYDHTPLGRYLYFVGEGRDVARLAGLPVNRLRSLAFVASATLAACGGVIAAGQLGSADPSVGANYLLPAFAAAFLGATTIRPGRFNPWGTTVALYLLITGTTGFQLLGSDSWVEQVFDGSALVIAVTLARLVSQEREA